MGKKGMRGIEKGGGADIIEIEMTVELEIWSWGDMIDM